MLIRWYAERAEFQLKINSKYAHMATISLVVYTGA